MADTAIEWTERVWNPTTGCDKASPGCDNCYALTMAKRLKGMGSEKYQTDGDPRTSGPGFGLAVHEDALLLPLKWRKPVRVFVNSMSDLFHPRVPADFIADTFATMAATEHTFQVLTKRAPRMRSLLNSADFAVAVNRHYVCLPSDVPSIRGYQWPLPNVWLGVSVEDQQRAAERIPALPDTPAAVRWLSCEPLLGPVDVTPWLQRTGPCPTCAGAGSIAVPGGGAQCPTCEYDRRHSNLDGVGWVVVGGESGPGARRMDPGWARSLRDQCAEAGVPFFMKQAGSVLAREWACTDPKGHNPEEWPEPFPRQYPSALAVA